jgi:hypothetical protein
MARNRSATSYERELSRLRKALTREEASNHQKDALMQQRDVPSKESDHRLLNARSSDNWAARCSGPGDNGQGTRFTVLFS